MKHQSAVGFVARGPGRLVLRSRALVAAPRSAPAFLPPALLFLLLALAPWALAGERSLPGPVPADLIEVIDGDTITVRAHVWLGTSVETSVRLAGIDAPELHGACLAERKKAAAARDRLIALLQGRGLRLLDIAYDKYGGRVVARVETDRGTDASAALLAAGLARTYGGGTKAGWCD
jgi:micrococcal nuclease